MEERKQKEIEYYDEKAKGLLKFQLDGKEGDFEGFNPFLLSSYKFLQEYLRDKCKNKKILDYGCGNGVHSFWLAEYGGEIIGVDLSEKSLEVARKKAKNSKVGQKVKFLVQDCEKMDFPDNSFDIIFNGGTFSSLDLRKAYPELSRVLKPEGFLVGIETFGHNPLTNLKREVNKIFGKRTGWAASHILRTENLEEARLYFLKTEVWFFHLISWITFPFLKNNGFGFVLNFFEAMDRALIKIPFLKKYCFKVVFVFSKPKKIIC